MASKGLLAIGATAGASTTAAVIAGAAILTAGVFGIAYLVDSVVLGVSKVDDLYRVGTYLNGVRDSCVKGVAVKKESIKDTRRALEEKGEGLVEVYESLSGEVLR